ncbi:MAG: phosphoribosylformylglycinamidine synthase I [Candidatus Infernicultor aquiphilus]|uniref:Phosphoribosylformylglycinamidine synthase subunit PurQ n=3 Tax=Candidatus Infernicultor aquiphilus TaxID=1805029 RepID=A0A1J5GT28_9BACT|nr:phosphoribosylformylglycinamidine synthase subunit PurQ [bacterium]OIP72738.1 MAG: phosphoribosylformylglycinamidine synthase I [Candidatus Atribacteria bacterium CG2_30_33_13]PIU25212.1 MAG: phosphoribosylformylglycinamidine synthase I [Candidatus Atribacteria bacterium CG08_land_8_20_14_0_20_33_29]PIW12335.1 MAG: phosphoribosylformylglycinamidine synthase I [Candidatus Atribacteria bacterium CG17_big_fil_post_rev_8_21_14_2_50_34_11]PIY32831.1 MAG: phosphoribosylformylglycinamidine synthase
MKFGVIQFPGSTCDYDCFYALRDVLKVQVDFIWHRETNLESYNGIILPGGFSYGDYLRVGAIARFSPIMKAVKKYSDDGGLVLGICNGFQILVEADLLPGLLIKNNCLHFLCRYLYLKVENNSTPYTHLCEKEQVLKIPIAHGEGNYYVDKNTLRELIKNNQIVLRYCDAKGEITTEANPNGSIYNIAAVCNKRGNVLGMMPHPERCVEDCLGSADGKYIFNSILDFKKKRKI